LLPKLPKGFSLPQSNEDWYYLLAGLIEACGVFERDCIKLRFHEKDYWYAHRLMVEFSGSLRWHDGSFWVSFATKIILKEMLLGLDGKLIGRNKLNQLHASGILGYLGIKSFFMQTFPAVYDVSKTYWACGFLSRHGTFNLDVFKASDFSLGFRCVIEFRCNQMDELLLRAIRDSFGAGSIKEILTEGGLTSFRLRCTSRVFNFNLFNYILTHHLWSVIQSYRVNIWLRACILFADDLHRTQEG
jgi:hypothetical protein